MAMKVCKDCGTEISSKAKTCPKCGLDQRNFYTKHKVLMTILVILCVATIGLALGEDTENGNTITASSQISKESYNITETYQDKYIKLTFLSMNDNFKNYNKYSDVKSNCNILKAEFEVENIGTSDQAVLYTEFKCYADGYACEEFYGVDDAGLTGAFNTTLSSGKKTKGNVYFQVPKNAQKVTIEYSTNMFSNEKVIFNVK